MMRIRKKFAIIVCAVCSLIFLCLYVLIGNSAPADMKKNNFGAIESKLQQLKNGLDRHGEEMQKLKSRIQQAIAKQDEDKPAYADIYKQTHKVAAKENGAVKVERKSEPAKCAFDGQEAPAVDIQMLDQYEKISFLDVDGGAWKQGWNIKYDVLQFNDHHKLKVFVMPHSHNDPGWLKTFDEYYKHDTKNILSNALRHLRENPEMRFIWAEISYFSKFYEDLGEHNKELMRSLVKNGQLEFVTGGWVMTDEANSHWHSVLLQLTEGQTWLKKYMNVTPKSSWSIDPFGYSPSMPYILKKSGMSNLLIQRTHYSVKKEFASKRNLEFQWRQLWDDTGATKLFTHMMPFYSYDIPHTCGPDPKICCQFDFKRMPQFGLSCPWRVSPQPITANNVDARAELIVDQWRKKAELYRTNVVLIPLGDDFRFTQNTEWEVQRVNFQALFDHINMEQKYFVEAKFGTLQEYFDAVHAEMQDNEFPNLSGDFFTYADRTDNYWSGYYTSRPYHKRMERVLLHYVRSAEMLHSWSYWKEDSHLADKLQLARRELSLFQHHDGITGTAKNHVVIDYANRMYEALKACQFVMQQSVYRLLTKPSIYNADPKFTYFYLDDDRWPGPANDSRTTIILGDELPIKHVVFHNSLPQWREELVDFYVASPYMKVTDFLSNPIQAQVNPVWTWHRDTLSNTVAPQGSATKYRLMFKAKVPPLGLATYVIQVEASKSKPTHTAFATNLILTTTPISPNLGDYPNEIKFGEHRATSLHINGGPTVAFSPDGLLKSIEIDEESQHMPVNLKFYKYGTRIHAEHSGAYLFLPNGPATPLDIGVPVVLIEEGPLEASITSGLPFAIHKTVLRGAAPEIRNIVDIKEMDNTEIVMRFSTNIQNEDVFYTDLNGLQIIKRKRFKKLPLQANYYPIPSAIFIEDERSRLTIVSAQPLGGSSLASGEIEIMQDRRLLHDDERGLGQGVLDNQPVMHIFRILLEHIESCTRPAENYPGGALTQAAHRASKEILNPIDKFIYVENEWLGVMPEFGSLHLAADLDMEVVAIRTLEAVQHGAVAKDRKGKDFSNTGVIIHRTSFLQCPANEYQLGVFNLKDLLQIDKNIYALHSTTLTFLQQLQSFNDQEEAARISICSMDTQAFVIEQRLNMS